MLATKYVNLLNILSVKRKANIKIRQHLAAVF